MKTTVVFSLLVGVALAAPQLAPAPVGGAAATAPAAGAAAPATGAAAFPSSFSLGVKGNPYGARVYGMGLNNPWSVPPNPFMMQRALGLIQNIPGVLIRVDPNGEINFTNQYGMEVDLQDPFGNDLSDLYEF